MDPLLPGSLSPSPTYNGNAVASTSSATSEPSEASADSNLPLTTAPETREPMKARIKNCSACRMSRCRRVAGQKDCVKCVQKGVACEAVKKEKKILNRTGRRIEEARALFGPSKIAADHLAPNFSSSSLLSRLNSSQLQGDTVATLLGDYLDKGHFTTRNAVVDGTAFRSKFERSGRQVTHLDEPSQVLCSVIMSVSARYTNHPLFTGLGAPSLDELRNPAKVGRDLCDYGSAREAACRKLEDQAIAMVDQKGTMRRPSPEAVAALLLLDGLLQDRTGSEDSSRSYTAAFISHSKTLCDEDTPAEVRSQIQSKALGWSPFVRDCLISVATGRSLSYTDDDLLALRGGATPPPPLSSALRRRINAGDRSGIFSVLSRSYVETFIESARGVAAKVTGFSARRAPKIDEAFINQFIETMALCKTAQEAVEEQLNLVSAGAVEQLGGRFDVLNVVRGLRVAKATLIIQVHRAVGERLNSTGAIPVRPLPSEFGGEIDSTWPPLDTLSQEDSEYKARLTALFEDVGNVAFEACRDICDVLKTTLTSNGSIAVGQWNDGRGASLLFTRLSVWLPILLNEKVAEEGGVRPEWTYATQIDDLTWILNAVYALGWAYASMSEPAALVRAELDAIRSRRDLFLTNAVLDPDPAPPAATFATPSVLPLINTLPYDESIPSSQTFSPMDMDTFSDSFQMPVGISDLDFQKLLESLGIPQLQQYQDTQHF